MQYNEGDLVEAVKGEESHRQRLVDKLEGLWFPALNMSVSEAQRSGWTFAFIEEAAPKLPSEPGWYEAAEYPISDGSYSPYNLDEGQWYERGSVRSLEDMARLMPLRRVEPVPVTAKKVLDAIRGRIGSIDSAHDFQAVAAEFGVTE